MRYFFSMIAALSCAGLSAAQPNSQTAADTAHALPPIEIVSSRYRLSQAGMAQRVHVLDGESIAASGSANLGDLLARSGSAFIRRYGSGLASISLRGAGASQTLILLDGLPVSDPQLGQLDLSLVPIGTIDRVSILHGAGSSFYGSSGMAGIVDIRTTSHTAAPRLQAAMSAGPYGERNAAAGFTAAWNRLSTHLQVAHERANDDYPYRNESLFPPQTVRRHGSDRTQTSLLGGLRFHGNGGVTAASLWITQAERGLPGPATAAPQDERQWDDLVRGWFSHTRAFGKSTAALRGGIQRSGLRYRHPVLGIDQASRATTVSAEGEWTASFSESTDVTAGVGSVFRRADHPSLAADAREFQANAFVLGRLSLHRLSLLPSWRIDTYFPESGRRLQAVSPQLGIGLQPLRNPRFRLKASAGRAFRAPTFNDRFWQPGGNPLLRPERGWTIEAGAYHEAPAAGASVTVFHHRFRDQIVWLPASQSFWTPRNLHRTRSTGVEASGRAGLALAPRASISAAAFYTFTHTEDRSDPASPSFGKPLRYTPEHQVKASLGLRKRFSRFQTAFDVFLHHTGLRYVTTDATQYMPAHGIVDIHARVAWRTQGASVSAGVFLENALNADYAVIRGYPMPPRHLRLQLSLQLQRNDDESVMGHGS